ncbi:MAG TPA: hypothetical protein VLG09_02105 [Candidatus Saccharimonadales bacterium]|nr:hypothetical protein [Candidatus Saccharimonadales bacterium]
MNRFRSDAGQAGLYWLLGLVALAIFFGIIFHEQIAEYLNSRNP